MSLAIAERPTSPDYQERDDIRLIQLGDMICRVDMARSAVVMDYKLLCKTIKSELGRTSAKKEDIDAQFDLTIVNWLKTYFRREQPDRDLPTTVILECTEAPDTPWLGGFNQMRDNFIDMASHSGDMYDAEDVPQLRFETPDRLPLVPNYPEDSQQWWRQNGSFVV